MKNNKNLITLILGGILLVSCSNNTYIEKPKGKKLSAEEQATYVDTLTNDGLTFEGLKNKSILASFEEKSDLSMEAEQEANKQSVKSKSDVTGKLHFNLKENISDSEGLISIKASTSSTTKVDVQTIKVDNSTKLNYDIKGYLANKEMYVDASGSYSAVESGTKTNADINVGKVHISDVTIPSSTENIGDVSTYIELGEQVLAQMTASKYIAVYKNGHDHQVFFNLTKQDFLADDSSEVSPIMGMVGDLDLDEEGLKKFDFSAFVSLKGTNNEISNIGLSLNLDYKLDQSDIESGLKAKTAVKLNIGFAIDFNAKTVTLPNFTSFKDMTLEELGTKLAPVLSSKSGIISIK